MATVRLSREEAEGGNLPRCCIRCGEPATISHRRRFRWQPSFKSLGVGLVFGSAAAARLQKEMTVHIPFCQRHQNHWRKPLVFNLLYLPVSIIGLTIFFLVDAARFFQYVCFAGISVLAIWGCLNVAIDVLMIGPEEITDESITLKGIHPRFQQALEQMRRGDDGCRETPPNR